MPCLQSSLLLLEIHPEKKCGIEIGYVKNGVT